MNIDSISSNDPHEKIGSDHESDSQSVKWPKGTQSVRRTLGILRIVSESSGKGKRLSEIARSLNLPIPTVKRILSVMVMEGFVNINPKSKRYNIGYDLYKIINEAHQLHIQNIYHVALENLARKTDDTVTLIVRSRFDSVCLDLSEGERAVRIQYGIGSRLPLGLGCSSLVLLALLPDEEMERVIAANASRYVESKVSMKDLRTQIQDVRKRGYNLRYESMVIEGIAGVSVPVIDHEKKVVLAAISVTSTSNRMTLSRCREIADLIKSQIDALGD